MREASPEKVGLRLKLREVIEQSIFMGLNLGLSYRDIMIMPLSRLLRFIMWKLRYDQESITQKIKVITDVFK